MTSGCDARLFANRDATLMGIGIVAGILVSFYLYLSFACLRAVIPRMFNGCWSFCPLRPRWTAPPPSPPPSSPRAPSDAPDTTSVTEIVIVLHSDASVSLATADTAAAAEERAGA
jgi:hypothetical protein